MKVFEKLHSSMPIKWSFDLLFDSGQLKMSWNCIFVYCFIEGSVSILNDIGSWTLAWTMVLTYIFIFWTRIGERSTLDPPPSLWGNPYPKHWRKKSGHTIYQMKALRKLYSNMPIKWFCMDTVLSYTLKYCRGGVDSHPTKIFEEKKVSGHVTHQMRPLEKPLIINANKASNEHLIGIYE